MGIRQLDSDTAALLDAAQAMKAPAMSAGTVAEARANYDANPKPPGDPVRSVVDDVVVGDDGRQIPVRRYLDQPTSDGSGPPIVVYFHGGGWVLSSVDGHDAIARRVASFTKALVVSVDYRLAPEHPFPAPHDDCWAVTAWLAANGDRWGGDPRRIVVAGDSAGGNLAAGVALRARDEGLSLSGQVLIYPCIDSDQEPYPSMEENAAGYLLAADDMVWFWDQYVPRRHRANPHAVPARALDLSGLAPALVQTAEFDPLRDEAEKYARRLSRAGVATEMTRYPGVVHGFVTREHLMARALDAHHELAQFIIRAFGCPTAAMRSEQ